jgi:uncharacterized protein YoxC
MVTEISLAIIAVTLVTLVGFLIVSVIKVSKAISRIEADIHQLSVQTSSLIGRFNELMIDITKKSKSLNFLFSPLSCLNKGTDLDEQSSQNSTLPQLVEWATTSFTLIKKAKEFIKKHVK